MPALFAYSNTDNTAAVILQNKGYQLWKQGDTYKAERRGWDFAAGSMTALLGLVSIFEHKNPRRYSEGWDLKGMEDMSLGDVARKPIPYTPVQMKSALKS